MALTIAFTRLVSLEATSTMWAIYIYFGFRKITYYITDIRFSDLCDDVFIEDSTLTRMFNLFLGVLTLFMFIVSGYYVIAPPTFFILNAITLTINLVWLVLLNNAIDPNKDKNNKLTISRMFKNFMIINIVEILLCVASGVWLDGNYQFNQHPFAEIENVIYIISLGFLFLIMFLDLFLHREFLFNPKYSISN